MPEEEARYWEGGLERLGFYSQGQREPSKDLNREVASLDSHCGNPEEAGRKDRKRRQLRATIHVGEDEGVERMEGVDLRNPQEATPVRPGS